jgi:hypothetical protein
MKKITLFLIMFTFNSFAQEPFIQWYGSVGGSYFDAIGNIHYDGNGNLLVGGTFQSTIDLNIGSGSYPISAPTGRNAFIAKYNTLGQVNWGVAFKGPELTYISDIGTDAAGNVYSTGEFFGTVDFNPGTGVSNLTAPGLWADTFISKLDFNGNYVWVKKFTGIGVKTVTSLATDASGNTYLTGYFNATTTFSSNITLTPSGSGADNYSFFVAKMDTSGNVLWVKQIGAGSISQRADSIALDQNGNIYLCGAFHNPTDFNPGTGQYILTSNLSDIFALKLDNDGNFIWAGKMGGDGFNTGSAITCSTDGKVYITGSASQTIDFDPGTGSHIITIPQLSGNRVFLMQLDSNGNFQWVKDFGGNGGGYSLNTNIDNSITVGGSYQNTCDFSGGLGTAVRTSIGNEDSFIANFSSAGTFNWVKCIGGSGNERFIGIENDSSGNIYAGGNFDVSAGISTTLDSVNFTSAGFQDLFLMRIGVESLDSDDFTTNSFLLYPNPCSTILNLKFPTEFEDGEISIYTITGQLVKTLRSENSINVESFAKGHYLFEISKGEKKYSTAFIIE